ncbi:MAG: hypothetical protein HC910_20480 [Spirulinaceae cyanobacterium SM2_1_0]|nr:hypothetical protein [Spirulinaceae cyanobacterium SM2_1_0]
MTALLVTERELHSPQELASRLQALNRWHEVETLTRTYADWKLQAWELLCPAERDRLKNLKRWHGHPLAERFPLGSIVQRHDADASCSGVVAGYWHAYGIDYVTFKVGSDTDWCRAEHLQCLAS